MDTIYINYFLENTYAIVFIYILISFGLAMVILFLNYLLTKRSSNNDSNFEKISSYECGFEPYGNSKVVFSFQYYIVALLFLIFDLELLFIFPWAVSIHLIGFFGYLVMFYFIILLIIGLVYEWRRGALDWV